MSTKETTDKQIRHELIAYLKKLHDISGHPEEILVIPEMDVNYGNNRIDIATINGIMHGYEIKSDSDTLNRLPNQVNAYNKVFDKISLVVGETHFYEALNIIPDWWGVILAKNISNSIYLYNIREAQNNNCQDSKAIAQLLWRNEAIELLHSIGQDKGIRSKNRRIISERLAKEINLVELASHVRRLLLSRSDWRVGQLQLQYDD